MPCPCRSSAMPCRKGFRLCLSYWIYTMRPCLIHTCYAMPLPRPCRALTMPFWKRLLKATAQHGMGAEWARHGTCELTPAVERRHVGDLPAFGFFRLPRGFPRSLLLETYQSEMQVTSVLSRWTSSSDISGFHADFHEGDGTVGAGQGSGTACVN